MSRMNGKKTHTHTPTRPGCIHRRVCTGLAIPYTYLQMCGGLKITKVSFGRTSSAGLLFFLVPGGHELFRSLQHPLVPLRPIVHLRRKGSYGSVNSECEPLSTVEPSVAPNAWKPSLRQSKNKKKAFLPVSHYNPARRSFVFLASHNLQPGTRAS